MPIVKALSEMFFPELEELQQRLKGVLSPEEFTWFHEPLSYNNVYRANGRLEKILTQWGSPHLAQLAHERRTAESRESFEAQLRDKMDSLDQLSLIVRDWRKLMKDNHGAHMINNLIRQSLLVDHSVS